QCENTSTLVQDRSCPTCHGDQAVGADLHGKFEAVAADVINRAGEVCWWCERHAMQDEVNLAEFFFSFLEDSVEIFIFGNITRNDKLAAKWFNEFTNFLFILWAS